MKLRSVKALTVAVIICMVMAAGLAVCAPWVVSLRAISEAGRLAVLISYYICLIPAYIVLFTMLKLLRRIRQKHPFDPKNPACIRIISWCCLAVAAVTAIGGIWYPPLYFVCGTMVFLFLVVQVVASCFKSAVLLQQENDLTI